MVSFTNTGYLYFRMLMQRIIQTRLSAGLFAVR